MITNKSFQAFLKDQDCIFLLLFWFAFEEGFFRCGAQLFGEEGFLSYVSYLSYVKLWW